MRVVERVCAWGLILLAGLALGFVFPAVAGEKPPVKPEPAPQGQKQEQAQQQGQYQVAEGGNAVARADAAATAGSTASADGYAYNGGNSVSQTYEDRLQAPSVFAPAVYASGSCAYGWSAGLSVPGGGISGGRVKPDPACDRRELARVLTPLNPQLALKILCADPIAREVATEADCTYAPEPKDDAPMVVILDGESGGMATKEELRRAFEASQGK